MLLRSSPEISILPDTQAHTRPHDDVVVVLASFLAKKSRGIFCNRSSDAPPPFRPSMLLLLLARKGNGVRHARPSRQSDGQLLDSECVSTVLG